MDGPIFEDVMLYELKCPYVEQERETQAGRQADGGEGTGIHAYIILNLHLYIFQHIPTNPSSS